MEIQEADADGNGQIDTWITANASGAVVEKSEDRNGDGKADFTARFEGERITEVEQDQNGRGCSDLFQRYAGDGRVAEERHDTDGDCKMDLWRHFEGRAPGARDPRHTTKTHSPMC